MPSWGGGQEPPSFQVPDIRSPATVPVNEISCSASTTPNVMRSPSRPIATVPPVTHSELRISMTPSKPSVVGVISIEKVPASGNPSMPHVPVHEPTMTPAPVGPVAAVGPVGAVSAGPVGVVSVGPDAPPETSVYPSSQAPRSATIAAPSRNDRT
jgi:hypothetical protein